MCFPIKCETLFHCWGSEVGKILSRSLLCPCSLLTKSHPSPFLPKVTQKGSHAQLCAMPTGTWETPQSLWHPPATRGHNRNLKEVMTLGAQRKSLLQAAQLLLWKTLSPKLVSCPQHTRVHTMVFKWPHRSCCCVLHSDAIQSLDVLHPVAQHQSHMHSFLKDHQTTRVLS